MNDHILSKCTGFVLESAQIDLSQKNSACQAESALPTGDEAKKYFLLDPEVTYLNHGSYGATLKSAMDSSRRWQDQMEMNCVKFMEKALPPAYRGSVARLANFVGAGSDDITFVPNATAGVNAVLRSLTFASTDRILITNYTYAAVKNIVHWVADRAGIAVDMVTLDFPASSNEQIVEKVKSALTEHTKVIVLDHIISAAGCILPVLEIAQECKKRGVQVLLDGAHAVGQVPLDLSSLCVDYYVSNCHKWLCAPKGCAFLWVNKERQRTMQPHVISHGYAGGFIPTFFWTGTDDYTSYLAVDECIDFFNKYGPEKIRQHNHDLVISAAHMLADKWGTGLLCPDHMFGSMANVRLPPFATPLLPCQAEDLRAALRDQFNIEVPVIPIGAETYVRISAQIYNKMSDYERLDSAIQKLSSTFA